MSASIYRCKRDAIAANRPPPPVSQTFFRRSSKAGCNTVLHISGANPERLRIHMVFNSCNLLLHEYQCITAFGELTCGEFALYCKTLTKICLFIFLLSAFIIYKVPCIYMPISFQRKSAFSRGRDFDAGERLYFQFRCFFFRS